MGHLRIRRELLAILYVFIFLVNDPQFARAHIMGEDWIVNNVDSSLLIAETISAEEESDTIHVKYALNGGVNHENNEEIIQKDELPVVLGVPTRAGYNFAGWYTDSSYQNKITEITDENASNMVLFAKWTDKIDNYYNVEMYSYQTKKLVNQNQKELKECEYNFVDDVEIPGMPSTRVEDYLNNAISSESQCMQGLCFTPDYILMTAYAESKHLPGSLMIFDRETGEFLLTLEMKKESHLGGITFDGENVWICHSNSNTLERISYEYINLLTENTVGNCVDASGITVEYSLKNKPSCITWYGGRLWVASYSKFFDSKMISYTYDDEKDKLVALGSYNIPCRVQGVAFDEDGSVYLSTSLGRSKSSYLKGYSSLLTMTKSPDEPTIKIEMPPCSEEIAIEDGNVYVLFESASEKYFEGTDGNGKSTAPIDKLLEVEMASIW